MNLLPELPEQNAKDNDSFDDESKSSDDSSDVDVMVVGTRLVKKKKAAAGTSPRDSDVSSDDADQSPTTTKKKKKATFVTSPHDSDVVSDEANQPTIRTKHPTGNVPARTTGSSALATAANQLIADSPQNLLSTELRWQAQVKGDAAKITTFRNEALQRSDLLVFGYMRPASPFIHVLHSVGTFSLPCGDDHYRGKEIAFVGDRTEFSVPTPVQLAPVQPWKWVTKKISLDSGPLEHFYADPRNSARLYNPIIRTGEQNTSLPRLVVIPPHFIEFCVTGQRTPFQFYKYVATAAASNNSPVTMLDCCLLLDWCIMASHHDTLPHTSVMAFQLDAAISTDETFNKWLQRRLRQVLGNAKHNMGTVPAHGTAHPPPGPSAPVHQHQFTLPPGAPPAAPPQDMWAQFAANLSQGLALAMQPTAMALAASSGGIASAYEDGGRNYDKFQLAVIRGFSHNHNLSGIQQIWALFQITKHTDTHRNNIKRKMVGWADAQRPPVSIDRNLYITSATLKDVLALRFNPGNTTAELETAEHGISILICRPRSAESKAAQRRKELIEGRASKSNLSLTDAERLSTPTETTRCPEDYNSLTKCLGTYCAFLHTLFGSRCAFFRHCMELLQVLHSDRVSERQHAFTPMFCRQVTWAIIEDGRAYFAKQLTPDDFIGVHPEDVDYPESTICEIKPNIRNQAPIFRSSFPTQWLGTTSDLALQDTSRNQLQHRAPLATVSASAPSIVSGITLPTAPTATASQQQPVLIRASTHPTIKTAFAAYVTQFKSIRLIQLLSHLNLTVADLPTMPGLASDTTLCYNYVLGRCVHTGCQHKHVPMEDIPDDFATALVTLLSPAAQHFITNGAPAQRRGGKRKRRTAA